jgi:hypothetical protein
MNPEIRKENSLRKYICGVCVRAGVSVRTWHAECAGCGTATASANSTRMSGGETDRVRYCYSQCNRTRMSGGETDRMQGAGLLQPVQTVPECQEG